MSVKVILSGIQSGLHRLHIGAHGSMIAALAVILIGAGLVSPGYGRGQKKPAPKAKGVSAGGAGFTSRADSEISTGAGLQLKRTRFEKTYGGTSYSFIKECPGYGGVPDDVSASSTRSFCYGSYHPPSGVFEVDTGFFFHYDISIPNGTGGWRPSGYYVDAAAKVPLLGGDGARKLDCTIKKSGSTNPAVGPPFRCDVSWTGSGNTSSPHWKVTADEEKVIDAANSANVERAAELIAANCKEMDTARCQWTRTQKSSAFVSERDDWVPLTHWADSCPPADTRFELSATDSVQISWSDKVGGKITGKVSGDFLALKVEASLEANYEHSVTQTNTYGRGYKFQIPLGYRAGLYVVFGMLEVTGDFSIVTDTGERFLVKNAVFRFPLKKDVKMDGRGQSIKMATVKPVYLPCDEEAPALGAPPPAKARIGLATRKSP